MTKERFLVTGCAGFIGGHVVERLVELGHEVTGVDDLSTGSRDNLRPVDGHFLFIEASVLDRDKIANALKNVDRVIHLASVPSVPRSVTDPMESAQASIIGTVTLLDECRKAGVKRVVQASSSSVYGDSNVMPRVETTLPAPMSPYAVAKLTQEYYGLAFYKCYGLDTAALRYFNVFGPRQNPDGEYSAVIPKFIRIIRAGGQPVVYGDGGQTRDFTYIDNVVDANIDAALCPKPLRGEAMNIGCGESYSLNDLLSRLGVLLGTDIAAEYKAMRTGDVRESCADVTKAGMLFGYKPKVTFDEGLRRTVEAF